jgi:predicted short-subunit dehydrogenase-like oxidoreductase (DUF2520 family)
MRIVLFGTGNMATRLGTALKSGNAEIIQVFGRNEAGASLLSGVLGCPYTTSKNEVMTDADFYIIAVTDEAISTILSGIQIDKQIVVHTSGSVKMDVLSSFAEHYGVLYPLQTLSVQKEVEFSNVPICIESNNPGGLEKIRALAKTISGNVVCIDSARRKQLHLAAVFVCNFVNHFYSIGESLLKDQQLDFDLLKPLILETASKALNFSPAAVQTGPAVRDNSEIMEMHLEMLESHPEWRLFYQLISKDILLHHN